MKGNFQVRFLEGGGLATARLHSTNRLRMPAIAIAPSQFRTTHLPWGLVTLPGTAWITLLSTLETSRSSYKQALVNVSTLLAPPHLPAPASPSLPLGGLGKGNFSFSQCLSVARRAIQELRPHPPLRTSPFARFGTLRHASARSPVRLPVRFKTAPTPCKYWLGTLARFKIPPIPPQPQVLQAVEAT